jgi:SAM-dependent methyltransferase
MAITANSNEEKKLSAELPYRVHLGPGKRWKKPNNHWVTVDIDPKRGDIAANFNTTWNGFPLPDNSTMAIYASHTFEHVSVFVMPKLMKECYRILSPGGTLRVIVPDPVRSMKEYLKGNRKYKLFERRIERGKKHGFDYTLFHALREDFISRPSQPEFDDGQLAHQNAWDFDAMRAELQVAGFEKAKVRKSGFQKSACPDFAYEGTYKSEANEAYRSMYVEAMK